MSVRRWASTGGSTGGSRVRAASAVTSAVRWRADPDADRSRPRWSKAPRARLPAPSTTATTTAAAAVTRTRMDGCHRRDRSAPIDPEAIAVPAHRFDGLATEWDIDLLAEVADVNLHHVGVHHRALVPDMVEQGGLRVDLAGVEGQVG